MAASQEKQLNLAKQFARNSDGCEGRGSGSCGDLLGAELPNCLKSPKFVIAGAAFFCAFLYSPVYIGSLVAMVVAKRQAPVQVRKKNPSLRVACPFIDSPVSFMDSVPSLEILVRAPEGFSLWCGPPFNNGQPAVKLEKQIQRDQIICSSQHVCSHHVPCGTYLQTFQRPSTPQEKNVILWKTETGAPVYQHFQKNMTKTTWPSVQFSSDEAIACRLATNEIQFFDARDFSKGIIYRVRIPGIAAVELSKAPGSHVAAFIPESKGIPASVQIFACGENSMSQPVARRSFFRCSTVQLSWNRGSTGLLVLVQADVDKTNQSYFGESKLNYLTTNGTHEGLCHSVCKEGPVHDVQWSYSGSEFAVVYGFMPAKATVFDKKCNPLVELGTGPYNTIRWNPKGKFLCLAGFGNLPGDMAFWDYKEKKQLGTTRAEWSVTSEWSPDGRYFMTATTAPRLQVDNG
ncbi:Eukaryotic translation initiation factor 2A [Vitis vinifera]|uniref:Eukaryotic translation initiation factor 2A n=1 Tax=Vitis vinifera TaxID=29760 RepID=A0A438DFS5_VITVI|nr:Eukaryotic translation initiation factor 2A [Vitis vinifera]